MIDVEQFGTPGRVWTTARRRVLDEIAAECARRGCTETHPNIAHDLSRVDPYDSTQEA